MTRSSVFAVVLALVLIPSPSVEAQARTTPRRPIPGPVVPPAFYRTAIENETRSPTGAPGPEYWQNYSSYDLSAELDPETGVVTGKAAILYQNRAPLPMQLVFMNLYQNLHRAGGVRSEPQEITGGVVLERLVVDGVELSPADVRASPGYLVNGTELWIRPERPLDEGDVLELEVEWSVTLPQSGAGRMGYSDREVYFVAYWFPKMAVYDDLRGWDVEPYRAGAEFYEGYGDYSVELTVPAGWTVMATGELTNPEEVLSQQTRDRLAIAATSDEKVVVASRPDRRDGLVTAAGVDGKLTYRFDAQNVRDFTWTTSNVQLWDATSAVVADRDGDGSEDRVMIYSFWRDDRAPLWIDQVLYAKQSIEHHSRFTGYAYPWPHMTSVEGADIIGGGMEFPMLTLIGDYNGRGAEDLYNVTAHELAHMWIPMIVGTNERRYAWMDEGSTTFLENQARPEYWPGTAADSLEEENYLQTARGDQEQELMRHGDFYEPGPGYGTASYAKPATLLVTLRNLLGEEVFMEGYRTFISEWAMKHPSPWDFFATFERVAGVDLDWFWSSWYFETWSLDQAVGDVRTDGDETVIEIVDRGFVPMPVRVRVRTTRAGVVERDIPVTEWLAGKTTVEIRLPASMGTVTRVDIDPEKLLPDVDRGNNGWRGPDN
ncbi:MAG: M1 family metallopeptidase [Longimicrobiales bacterium]